MNVDTPGVVLAGLMTGSACYACFVSDKWELNVCSLLLLVKEHGHT